MNTTMINTKKSIPFQKEYWLTNTDVSPIIEPIYSLNSYQKRKLRKQKYNNLFK